MYRSPAKHLRIAGAIFWLLAAVSVFTIDGPFAEFDVSGVPGDLRRIVQLAEVFAHGAGITLILVAMWSLDRVRRSYLPRVCVVAFLPGIIATAAKLFVTRERPRSFEARAPAYESFLGLPGTLGVSELQSFPSGHTATAVGLAFGLSSLYPRGRYLFAGLALLAATQRVLFEAHFVSDTLVSAGIACFVAAALRDRLFWDARGLAPDIWR
ncbi:MAG: phosphatase PAP2 family protein [Planctomycetaceae bacterium]|nr:phosphatase PAP2 family protein [Planctomycetales bacterium]MCB9874882.1 phosphatase PAP2 family protein [Planctomycetaceae bacterium]MCB9939149.1 phosphatase PAP2 family protein [Planctomycetaceae bacterium]